MITKNITLNEIIIKSAIAGLKLQREDGSFPPGHNGPWNDFDTPTRVTAHWSILLLEAYKITKNKLFKEAAIGSGNYLISKKCRPYNFSFFCRKKKNKCNGLIGQAWVIEALIELGLNLKDHKYFQIAEEVVLMHHFNEKKGLWYNLEIDGKRLNINRTLNQQIWFGAISYHLAKITNNFLIKTRTEIFFEKLPKQIHFNGQHITHLIHPFSKFIYKKESRGYLSFTLMGLAMVHDLNKSILNEKIIKYVQKSMKFLNENIFSKNSKFCWSYNPTGFEAAYVINTFVLDSPIIAEDWIVKQLDKEYNFQTGLMNLKTSDPNTLSARIYEITYLPNLKKIFS